MVVAPKQSTKRVLPPPPIPVTEQPLYTTPRPPLINKSRGFGKSDSNEALQQSLAVARELSARYGSKPSK